MKSNEIVGKLYITLKKKYDRVLISLRLLLTSHKSVSFFFFFFFKYIFMLI